MVNIQQMRQRVFEASLSLPRNGLVLLTWGNVSEYDAENGLIAIKASGVSYDGMSIGHITVVDLDGNVVEGEYKPSVDLPIHCELYRKFSGIKSVVHTHSMFATIWAQTGKDLPCLGTTHADYFYGAIPCTREMTKEEIFSDYALSTGKVIAQTFLDSGRYDYMKTSASLVYGHGPFVWGKSPEDAVKHAVVLEAVAKMAVLENLLTNGQSIPLHQDLQEKHYQCRFGPQAYYGQ